MGTRQVKDDNDNLPKALGICIKSEKATYTYTVCTKSASKNYPQ